jgi:hypothetical protein
MMGMGKHELDEPVPDMTLGEPPAQRRDHIWVLFLIAACALAEVFGSWLGIASVSGFPHYGPVTTGWVLFATTEGFWGYALWSWLAGAPGPRSRRFAMTSAIVMFVLSFVGQEAGHLVATAGRAAPWYVVAIVTPLPLVAVGLIAILIHLRQADREAAEAAWRKAKASEEAAAIERAEADERAWLRRELEAASAQREADAIALASAQRDLAEALSRADALSVKLEAASGRKPARVSAPHARRAASAVSARDGDVTTELQALMELRANPDLRKPRMGGALARVLGVSPATGRRYHKQYVNADGSLKEPLAEPLAERSS